MTADAMRYKADLEYKSMIYKADKEVEVGRERLRKEAVYIDFVSRRYAATALLSVAILSATFFFCMSSRV